jgi:hypothetical protein
MAGFRGATIRKCIRVGRMRDIRSMAAENLAPVQVKRKPFQSRDELACSTSLSVEVGLCKDGPTVLVTVSPSWSGCSEVSVHCSGSI